MEQSGIFASPSIVQISASEGSQATVTVASSADWQVISDQEWLAVNPLSGGPGHTVITLTVAQNIGSELRRGVLTLSASGLEERTVTIEQGPMITVSAGTLKDLLAQSLSLSTAHALTLSGTIDARDFRTMRDWALTEGYKVKVTGNCILPINGTPAVFPLEIPLKTGWNIISYPKQSPADAMEVVQQLIDRHSLVKVQDEEGNAIEDFGSFGGWQNNIGAFIPGKGYRLKVSTNDTLTMDDSFVKSKIVSSRNLGLVK